MKKFFLLSAMTLAVNCCVAWSALKEDTVTQTDQVKLEDLLPEKSIFGPSASAMAFSHEGKYAAYLYRPYKERRHGNDLFIYDVEKGVADRITWPSVMAKFQKNTRKVVADRIEKAKKDKPKPEEKRKETETEENKDAEQGKESEDNAEGQSCEIHKGENAKEQDKCTRDDEQENTKDGESDEQTLRDRGDWVGDKDADDEKAPKYNGITGFKWSPNKDEIIFESEGDLFRFIVADRTIVRLTATQDSVDLVQWLPDGSGCIFRRQRGLYLLKFGRDVLHQIDPKFPNGDTFERYSLSEDGRHIAFVTSKEIKPATTSKVEIATYKDRLMKAREVQRHVSDDPLPVRERRVYIYTLSEAGDERDILTEVFKCQTHMPNDTVGTPVWSPDSKRVAFFMFEQDPAIVTIYEVRIVEEDTDDKDRDHSADKKADGDRKDTDAGNTGPDKDNDRKAAKEAKEVFRFLHYGGPNTPRMMALYYLGDSRRIAYLSEQTGFRHLHVIDPVYESVRPLTRGSFEVYPISISRDRRWIFVHATREHPSQTDVYRVSTRNGRMVRLTQQKGTHSETAVSEDGTKVLTNLVSYEQLKELVFINSDAGMHKILTDSHPEKAHTFAEPKPEFFDYTNRHGQRLYGMMFKPDDWTKYDKRPVLIYFYGGPLGTRKMVVQGSFAPYNYAFPYYMAKKHGWIACTIDTRGNSGYAGVFEKANFGQVGRPQVEDLVDGVKFLVDRHGVDTEKVAIHGWIFGGFQTQMCMYTEPDVFKVGIAGAGPTEWENYNSWYTRHAIGKSEPGAATLKEFSLLPLAKNLKGHLLLVHGMEDDNVLYQDTVRVYRELLKAGKETQVELFLDPTGGHGLGGDVKTLSRYRKYEQFLLQTIGPYQNKTEE